MSPEQLIREAAANLAKSDRLHLQVVLTLDPQDGSEAEPGNLGRMELFADGLQGNAGHLGGDVRFLSNGETVAVDFYSDGEWVYATIDGEGVRIPIAGTGMDGLLAGMRLPAASELLSEPEVQVEEERTLLIYRLFDSELNSMLEKSAGGLGLLFPNGIPVLGDGEMVIELSEGEIREITCNVLTVGESPTEFQAVITFFDTTDMFELKPPEGYDTFPELAVKEIAGAGS
ncbi:MAG: hypothetical protein IKT60_02310 [Clostridia bacterium]|nr:hypothetical protein [Clostridia bacterium]